METLPPGIEDACLEDRARGLAASPPLLLATGQAVCSPAHAADCDDPDQVVAFKVVVERLVGLYIPGAARFLGPV